MAFKKSVRLAPCVGSLVGLLALATTGGCVQEQDYLIVERAVWFNSPDACTLDASADPPVTMVADVLGDRIGLGFVVTNNQTPNAGSNSGIDDSQIEVESAEVRLSFSGGGIVGDSYEVTVPNNALSGGDSSAFLVQVPTETVESMRAQMTVGQYELLEMSVVFVGRKYGQSGGSKLGEVTTREYTYPIEICMGCVECAACGFPQPTIEGGCPEVEDPGTTDTTGGP